MPTMKMGDVLTRIKRLAVRIRTGDILTKEDLKAQIILGLPGWAKTEAPLSKFKPGYSARVDIPDRISEDLTMVAIVEQELRQLVLPQIKTLVEHANAEPLEPHLLMFDELPQGDTAVAKIISGYVQNREVQGLRIPDNVIIVATGNQRKHQSGVGKGLAHLTSRFKVINIEPDIDGWLDWGATTLHSDVLAYIHMKPQASYCWSDNANDETMAQQYRDAANDWIPFPSARSWTTLSAELKANPDSEVEDFAGHVGPERAAEFYAMRSIKIPSHADLIEGRAEMPTQAPANWVAAIRCGQLLTPGNARKTAKLMAKLNPELVEVGLKVAGKVALNYLKSKNLKVANGHMALISCDGTGAYYFPGFSEELLSDGSRYRQMMEVKP